MDKAKTRSPLSGVRVLDLSRFLAGPLCGMLLADMGAEVIRIEPLGGMVDRTWGILGPDSETITHKILGRNKKAITLNLNHNKGKAVFKELVRRSDVVLHNFPPGTSIAQAISYEKLKEINSAIVVAVISGYGLTGPDADKICFDFVTQARSGAMTLNGFPGDPPQKTTVPYVDCGSGLATALGIALALYHREKTGVGQLVDVSLFDVASFFTQQLGALLYYKIYGEIRKQFGNFGFASFMTCLRAKDGWVMVVASSNDIWNRFIAAIGKKKELGEDPRFNNDMSRSLNASMIDPVVQEWAAERDVHNILESLQNARVPCSVVNTVDHMLNDPQLKSREMITLMDYEKIGKIPIPGVPIKLSATPGSVVTPAPRIGQDNEEVYCKFLGFSRKKFNTLRKECII